MNEHARLPEGQRAMLLGLAVLVVLVNAWYLAELLGYLASGSNTATDWGMIARGAGPHPFDDLAWKWSPVTGWLLVPFARAGLVVWTALHFAAIATIRDRRLLVAVLLSWPFWWDVAAGNLMVFVFVAAYWSLRRSSMGTFALLVLALLVPRPLMVPLVAWALWTQPEWRGRFAVMFALHAALVVVSGYGPLWIDRLVHAGTELDNAWNVGPSRLIGIAWAPVGLALSAVALYLRRPGLAALLAQPYWLPNYLLVALLELRRDVPVRDLRPGVDAARGRPGLGEHEYQSLRA